MNDPTEQDSDELPLPEADPADGALPTEEGAALRRSLMREDFEYDAGRLLDPDIDQDVRNREWDRVFQEFNPRLEDYFRTRTQDDDELDDVLAHTWRRALLGLGTLQSTRAAWSWLVTVGGNHLKDRHRRRAARRRRDEGLASQAVVDEDLRTRLPDALERMARSDPFDEGRWPVERETFIARWTRLTEADRRMIWLHDVENWTHEKIAAALNIKPGTARQRYTRAMKVVRDG